MGIKEYLKQSKRVLDVAFKIVPKKKVLEHQEETCGVEFKCKNCGNTGSAINQPTNQENYCSCCGFSLCPDCVKRKVKMCTECLGTILFAKNKRCNND